MMKNIGSAFLRKCGHALTVLVVAGLCVAVFWRWGVSETTVFVIPWILAGVLIGRSLIRGAIERLREPAAAPVSRPAAHEDPVPAHAAK
jgi:hypothetical protein